jgi:hypothetical protein
VNYQVLVIQAANFAGAICWCTQAAPLEWWAGTPFWTSRPIFDVYGFATVGDICVIDELSDILKIVERVP